MLLAANSYEEQDTAYLVLVKYILTGRDAPQSLQRREPPQRAALHPTRLSEYSFVPHLAAKGCI